MDGKASLGLQKDKEFLIRLEGMWGVWKGGLTERGNSLCKIMEV